MASKRPTKRSAAAKRGWETRKANERQRALEARRAAKKRKAANAKRQDTKAKKKSDAWISKTLAAQLAKARAEGRREGAAKERRELLTAQLESYFGVPETPEERKHRMGLMWREIEGMQPRLPRLGYIQMLRWIQRNGFRAAEFWAEYKRRQGSQPSQSN
jgi:hypothetical protein